MSAILDGAIIIGGSTVLSVGGLFLVRKKFKSETQKACHEVGGYLLAIIGSLYAILLGMIVVGSNAKVDQAAQKATVEGPESTFSPICKSSLMPAVIAWSVRATAFHRYYGRCSS